MLKMEGSSPPSPSNVSHILKPENDLKQAEIAVSQISRQFSEIVGNMVVICTGLGQGRTDIEEEMNQVSGILRSLNEKIELLEADQENIGSVLLDIMTMGGMIRRMKLKNAAIIATTIFDDDAADVEAATSSTTNTNDEQEARRYL